MTITDKMQKLHHLASLGKELSSAEKAELNKWYENLDMEETQELGSPISAENNDELRRFLAESTKHVVKVSQEIESILAINSGLRNENKVLRKTLESRLVENAA